MESAAAKENEYKPMLVTLAGMVILVSAVTMNAASPMFVTVDGTVYEVPLLPFR